MRTHNDVELLQAGEAPKDLDNRIQIGARKLESQDIHFAYRVVVQAFWDHTLKDSLYVNKVMHL
jgi:hypothetical protein